LVQGAIIAEDKGDSLLYNRPALLHITLLRHSQTPCVLFATGSRAPSRKNGFALKAAELNVIIFYGHIFRTRIGHAQVCEKYIFAKRDIKGGGGGGA